MRLEVSPNPAFADETVRVRVSGAGPGERVFLRAAVEDDAGRVWQSEGLYLAGGDGSVDTALHESTGGSYRGVDAHGLFWSMAPPARHFTFSKHGPGPDRVSLAAGTRQGVMATAVLERRWLEAHTERRELGVAGLVGSLFLPPGRERRRVIIVLGGSGGGQDLDKAALLSRHGFATLALAYFGVPPLAPWLHGVPLESLARAIQRLGELDEIDHRPVGLLGVSRGAELALLAASRLAEIGAVAAYAPSAVAWSSGGRDKSTGEAIPSWTWNGRAIPFAPLPLGRFMARSAIPVALLRRPVKFRNLFRSALRHREAVGGAMIPVERARGPMLLVSGGDDWVWPAAPMAEMILERLASCGRSRSAEHVNYPRAGHSLRYPFLPTTARMSRSGGVKFPVLFGGSAAADGHAQEDAWRRTIAFFRKNL